MGFIKIRTMKTSGRLAWRTLLCLACFIVQLPTRGYAEVLAEETFLENLLGETQVDQICADERVAMELLEKYFDPAFDVDIERGQRWLESVDTSHEKYVQLKSAAEWQSTNLVQINCRSILERLASRYTALATTEDKNNALEEVNCSEPMKRAIRVESAFHAIQSSWKEGLLPFQRAEASLHDLMLSSPTPTEQIAIAARSFRQLSSLVPCTGNPQRDQMMYGHVWFCLSPDSGYMLNTEQLRRSPVSWYRLMKMIPRFQRNAWENRNVLVSYKEGTNQVRRVPWVSWQYRKYTDEMTSAICSGFGRCLLDADEKTLLLVAKDVADNLGVKNKESVVKLMDGFDLSFSQPERLEAFRTLEERKQRRHRTWGIEDSGIRSGSEEFALSHSVSFESYPGDDSIQDKLTRYHLRSGVVVMKRDDNPGTESRLSYLIFKPGKKTQRMPVLVFIPGVDEVGFDLRRQFKQAAIFDIVTSETFQKRHPCYFLVVAPKDGTTDLCGSFKGRAGKLQQEYLDALDAIITSCHDPEADRNRIYATGLSFGGSAIYGLSFVRPSLFAAVAPISSLLFGPERLPDGMAGNYYHFYNEGEFREDPEGLERLSALEKEIQSRGGDFRIGSYPSEGHNAWVSAWKEEILWDWMFSKASAPDQFNRNGSRTAKRIKAPQRLLGKASCSASKSSIDKNHSPERAIDGLSATAYVSASSMSSGDWFLCVCSDPIKGRIRIQTGNVDGTRRLSRGHVEVSVDGRLWTRSASVSPRNGEAVFEQKTDIRFVKLLPEPKNPEPLVLREIQVE